MASAKCSLLPLLHCYFWYGIWRRMGRRIYPHISRTIKTAFMFFSVCACAVAQLVMSGSRGRMTNRRHEWRSNGQQMIFVDDGGDGGSGQTKKCMSKWKAISSNDKFTVTRCLWRLESLSFFIRREYFSRFGLRGCLADDQLRWTCYHMRALSPAKMSSKIMFCRLPFQRWLPFFRSIWLWLWPGRMLRAI